MGPVLREGEGKMPYPEDGDKMLIGEGYKFYNDDGLVSGPIDNCTGFLH